MLKYSNVKIKQKAFTVIELLIVISVIVILSAVVFISYQSGQQQFALQRSANKLAQDIRRVQEMAMSAQECTPVACPSPPYISAGGIPAGGYGFYIDKSQNDRYFIYADTGQSPKVEEYSSSLNEEIETIYLEEGVYIDDFIPSSNGFSINFKPPDPEITIKNNAGVDSDNITIIIALTADSLKTKTILVNKAGRIEID